MDLLKKTLLKSLLPGILFAVLGVNGCKEIYLRNPFSAEPPIVLHLIENTDIFYVPNGAQIEWDDSNDIAGDLKYTEKDGWFVSSFYMEEIMKAQVE